MAILTVPGSEIDVTTPNRAAHLDAGALTAPTRATLSAIDSGFRGKQQVTGAIEGVGEELGGLANDMLKVHRANIAADADFRMRAAQQSFLESIRNDQNEHDWTDRAAAVSEQTRQDIFASHNVPPGMRAELENSIKSWGQALQIKTQTLAQVQSINRAELSIRKSYDEAGRDGDAVGMANAVALGRSSKLDPVAMDEMEQNIPRALATTAIENGLRTNPQGTHDLLASGAALPIVDQHGKEIVPSKVYAPKELQSLVNTARVQAAAWQKTNAEDLLQTAADPITGMVPENVINAKMKSKEISEAFGRSLIASQERKVKAETAESARAAAKEDRDAYNLVTAKVHDPTAWGLNPEEYAKSLVDQAAEISDPALRQRAINDANHQLAAVKKTGETAERPVERAMYELMSRDLSEQSAMVPVGVVDVAAEKHLFKANVAASTLYTPISGGLTELKKKDDLEIEALFGKGTKKEQVVRAAEIHAAKLKDEMRRWFQSEEGSKATFEQADEHRRLLERPYVMDAVKATLAKRVPVAVSTQEEFDALPPGAPFVFNGRLGTKN